MNNGEDLQLLNMDLASVDTSYPLVEGGVYDVRVVSSDIVPMRDASKGRNWKLVVATTSPVREAGKPTTIEAGHQITTQAALNPTGKAKMQMVVQNVARIVQSAKLTGANMATIDQWHKTIEGRVCRVRVEVERNRTDKVTGRVYPPANTISEWLKS